jgi:hypothetical protein
VTGDEAHRVVAPRCEAHEEVPAFVEHERVVGRERAKLRVEFGGGEVRVEVDRALGRARREVVVVVAELWISRY